MAETLEFVSSTGSNASTNGCSAILTSRIATKTFDAIHRSHVFSANWIGQAVILKAWEVSETQAGREMMDMYVLTCLYLLQQPLTRSNTLTITDRILSNPYRYENEKKGFEVMATSNFVPRILADGYIPRQHDLALETRILIMEFRHGERLRDCWQCLSVVEKAHVHDELVRFFKASLARGIYHDDLRHLRNCLWDRKTGQLTVLDFELVGVQWKGPFTEEVIERVTRAEVDAIWAAAEGLA